MADKSVTQIIERARAGDHAAAAKLMPLIYDELRALAQSCLSRERPGHTLQATAIVHEVFLRLVDQHDANVENRAHFFSIAAQAIRRILIDHARGKGRSKRGGDRERVPLAEDLAWLAKPDLELLALDEALAGLAKLHERQARIVELRFFGGMELDEIARLIGVSPRTVDGDWAMARAWLRRELEHER